MHSEIDKQLFVARNESRISGMLIVVSPARGPRDGADLHYNPSIKAVTENET